MKNCPTGSYYVAICNVPDEDDDIKIVFISYTYNAKKVLHFVTTAGAGSTVPDENRAYTAKFPDEFGNVAVRKVPRPACLSDYFEKNNCVDVHNQMHQGILGLEEKWVTQCGFFRIFCSIFGMCVIDTKEVMRHGLAQSHPLAKASVKRVAGGIADDIFRRMNLTDETRPSYSIPALSSIPGVVGVSSTRSSDASSAITGTSPTGASIASSAATSSYSWIVSMPAVGAPPGIPEYYREKHKQAETEEWSTSECRKLRKRCASASCMQKGLLYCVQCHKFFCKDGSRSKDGQLRFCMWDHICSMFQQSHIAGEAFDKEYGAWQASQEE